MPQDILREEVSVFDDVMAGFPIIVRPSPKVMTVMQKAMVSVYYIKSPA